VRRWGLAALGVVAAVGAIYEFTVGDGWVGFWLAVLALELLMLGPRRRYWERVGREDPAVALLQSSWVIAAAIVGSLALGVGQLAGIGFRHNGDRGVLALVGAGAFTYGLILMRGEIRRIRSASKIPSEPLSDHTEAH
jgi:hypothetical protein